MPLKNKVDVQWILDALAADRTKTRKGLGDAIGIDRSGVTRLLKGERALKMRESFMIAEYLGVAGPFGFAEEQAPFTRHGSTLALAPIYRVSEDESSEEFWRLHRNEPPVDHRPKAPILASATLVFGLYARDDSMAPRYKAGELIFVDPARPIAAGDDALFTSVLPQTNAERAIVGELVSATPSQFTIKQHARAGEKRLAARTWTASLIVRCY